jgi:hypothetical protein
MISGFIISFDAYSFYLLTFKPRDLFRLHLTLEREVFSVSYLFMVAILLFDIQRRFSVFGARLL